MAEPKWGDEREFVRRAAQLAGPHTRTISEKERKRRADWMRGMRRRTLERKKAEAELRRSKHLAPE